MDVLAERLSLRGTDCGDSIRRRLAASAGEIRYCGAFDYIVTNDDLGSAASAVEAIYTAEKARTRNRAYPVQAAEYEAGALGDAGYWRGRRVIVTAGPTREPIDDVRFVSNRSSGLMGCEMAAAFRDLGAETVLLLGPGTADAPPGVRVVGFRTSADLLSELPPLLQGADLLAMSAAVADYRPVSPAAGKTPRRPGGMLLELETVPDIVAGLSGTCPVLSFSLEYGGGSEARAMAKLRDKGVSASFCNRGDLPGQGIDSPVNSGILLFASGESVEIPAGAKRYVAAAVAAAVGRWLAQAAAQR
jgi:phosphopantothenoylcysteine decarboxylase/phosphopantothenate--cysteine ligase